MNDADIAVLLRDGMLVMLKLGGPPLLVALAVGLVVSLLQAVTQINEATLAFVPKVLALVRGAGAARAVHVVHAVRLHPHAVRPADRHRRLMTGDEAALLADAAGLGVRLRAGDGAHRRGDHAAAGTGRGGAAGDGARRPRARR